MNLKAKAVNPISKGSDFVTIVVKFTTRVYNDITKADYTATSGGKPITKSVDTTTRGTNCTTNSRNFVSKGENSLTSACNFTTKGLHSLTRGDKALASKHGRINGQDLFFFI